MKNYISIAKFGKNYYMIILIIGIVGTYFGYWETFIFFLEDKEKHLGEYGENKLMLSFLKYLGWSYFGIGELIRKKINKESSEFDNLIKTKDMIYIGLISFAVLVAEFLAIVIRQINGKDYIYLDEYYNIIEFTILILSSKFIFKTRYFKHQYISIVIIFIFEIIRYTVKFEQYFKFDNFFLSYFLQMIRAFVDSIFVGYSKGLMNYKYFSPYKVTYIFGIIDLIAMIVIYFIVSIIPINKDSTLCYKEYNGKCYIDNFLSLFDGFSFTQFLCLFFHSVFVGLGRFILNYILSMFSTCHLIVYYNFCEFFINCKNPHKKKTFLIISSIVEFFIIFVFLEIIELNCFGLSKNTNDNIEKRAMLDTMNNEDRESLPTDEKNEYDINLIGEGKAGTSIN